MDLVLFVGLQASGKTSFYRERFAATHALVSKDLLRSARDREARQRAQLREALVAGRSVVVDNTNVSRESRAPLLALGKSLGARLVGYVFTSRIEECLVRNAAREGRSRVPPVALYAMRRRLEWPSPEEGFDALYRVELRSPSGFDVTRWRG